MTIRVVTKPRLDHRRDIQKGRERSLPTRRYVVAYDLRSIPSALWGQSTPVIEDLSTEVYTVTRMPRRTRRYTISDVRLCTLKDDAESMM